MHAKSKAEGAIKALAKKSSDSRGALNQEGKKKGLPSPTERSPVSN